MGVSYQIVEKNGAGKNKCSNFDGKGTLDPHLTPAQEVNIANNMQWQTKAQAKAKDRIE